MVISFGKRVNGLSTSVTSGMGGDNWLRFMD